MSQKTIQLDRKPYFIHETESGIFYVVNAITFEDLIEDVRREYTNHLDTDIGELKRGLDIEETPNRNLSLLVRYPRNGFVIQYAIQELKKYAEISDHDFVSFEPFGESIIRYIATEGNIVISEVRPRLFRKFVDN